MQCAEVILVLWEILYLQLACWLNTEGYVIADALYRLSPEILTSGNIHSCQIYHDIFYLM